MKQNFSTSLTSMTSFFRRTLFFVLLLGGVCNVWGADQVISLTDWTSYDSSTHQTSGGSWNWTLSVRQDQSDNLKKLNDYTVFKDVNSATIVSTSQYTFSAGTYTLILDYFVNENGIDYYQPQITLNGTTIPSSEPSKQTSTGQLKQSYNYVFENVAAGTYTITITSKADGDKQEKFGLKQLTIHEGKIEKEKVNALIVKGDNNTTSDKGGTATMSLDKVTDPKGKFDHYVLKFTFSSMNNHYHGYQINRDNDFTQSATVGATGFGFWYMTDGDFTLAFCFDYNNGSDQMKRTLPSTKGQWAYMYVAQSAASNFNNDIIIYVNGSDNAQNWPGQSGTTTTSVDAGTFYISEIRATEITQTTVTFDMQGHGTQVAQQSIDVNGKVTEPSPAPTADNYEFGGWYKESACTNAWNFASDKVTKETTLYAKWTSTVVQYDVKYYDGSTELGTEKVASGDTPKNYGNYQTKANHDFVNWYNESNWQTVANFSTAITANKDFYGKWTEHDKFAITVEVASSCAGQGTVNGSGEYYQGAEITISATPATGYSFQRWNDNNTSASRQITVNEAKTYTAYFEENTKVNALIVTGTSTNKGGYIADWSKKEDGTITIANVDDSKFGHQVLQFTYEMPNSGSYAGITVPKDGGYSSSSSAGATGFGFWYKTESSSDNVAFVLDADEGANNGANQMKMLLTGTNGTWQYKYCTSGLASQWNSSMRVWINKNINDVGQTANASGNIYISEIRATEITQITYALTLSSSDPTYGTVACTSHPSTMSAIPSGASVTVKATENEGSFVHWVDENDTELSTSSQYTFTMTGHKTVTGVFSAPVQKYTVSATMGEHGASVSGTGDYAEDASVILTPIADENYSFKNWSNVSGVSLTSEQLTHNPLKFTMPANAVSVKANFEFDAVENIIATGTSANAGSNDLGSRDGSYTWTGTDDPQNIFENDVLEISYSMDDITTIDQSYAGHNLVPDDGYAVDSKATGIAFWYMTEKSDDQVYMEIKASGTQLIFKLPATNGVWTYKYQETGSAKTATSFELWVNGKKDNFAMQYNSGKFYLAEIQATNVTERDPKSSCGTCFPVDFSN